MGYEIYATPKPNLSRRDAYNSNRIVFDPQLHWRCTTREQLLITMIARFIFAVFFGMIMQIFLPGGITLAVQLMVLAFVRLLVPFLMLALSKELYIWYYVYIGFDQNIIIDALGYILGYILSAFNKDEDYEIKIW